MHTLPDISPPPTAPPSGTLKSHRQKFREFVMSGVFEPILGQPSAIAVFLAYLAHANDEGEAWLSNPTICKAFGISEDSVTRGRHRCVEAGLMIDTGKFQHRCKVFRLALSPAAVRVVNQSSPRSGADLPPAAVRGVPPAAVRLSPAAVRTEGIGRGN